MKMQKLSQEINQIHMPEEIKNRIMRHCYREVETQKENNGYGRVGTQKESHCFSKMEVQNRNRYYTEMEKKRMRKNKQSFRKPMAAAVIAVCFCMIGVTALASGGKLEGYFKDIVRWDGAVVGTSYEQATDEIKVRVISEVDELIVEIEMTEPDKAPYSCLETFKIGKYEMADANGKIVVESNETKDIEIVNGRAEFILPIAELSSGNYKLLISEFVGSAKAEQPLVLSGTWECEFTR